MPDDGVLTSSEKQVVRHLGLAWGHFVTLSRDHPSETAEFVRAIHAAQALVGLRVARRADPGFWTVRETEEVVVE